MSKKICSFLKESFQVVFLALVFTLILRSYVVEARVIPSPSMIPTLQVGDRLLVDKIIYKATNLNREDIVVFAPPIKAKALLDPSHKNDDLIKRIIGLPGDKIRIIDGKIEVNDQLLTETYVAEKPNYTFGPVIVPNESVFVLGDNRNNSLDSHYWGFLPINNIVGRAFFKYWPPKHIGRLYDR